MSDKRLLGIAVAVNSLLFTFKLFAWFGSHSLGLLSDAVNSGSDVLLYGILTGIAGWSSRAPDHDHPFGHSRGEPVGAIVAGIFIAVVALELAWRSCLGLIKGHETETTLFASSVLLISILVKIVLGWIFTRQADKTGSPMIKAARVDLFADAAASSVALMGLVAAGIWDAIAGIAVALWIGVSSWAIIKENISLLVGKSPDERLVKSMMETASRTPGVKSVKGIRAHHVGPDVHLEITITVSPELSLAEAHDIGDAVRKRLESLNTVQQAFVHIDPD